MEVVMTEDQVLMTALLAYGLAWLLLMGAAGVGIYYLF
jgi:hypothetical protein